MPLYEFECLQCGAIFEKLVKTAGMDWEVVCPKCGARRVEERLSTFSTSAKARSAISSRGCAPGGG